MLWWGKKSLQSQIAPPSPASPPIFFLQRHKLKWESQNVREAIHGPGTDDVERQACVGVLQEQKSKRNIAPCCLPPLFLDFFQVRVVASLESRKERGWSFMPEIDDADTECALDAWLDWDVILPSDENQKAEHAAALDKIFEAICERLRRRGVLCWLRRKNAGQLFQDLTGVHRTPELESTCKNLCQLLFPTVLRVTK